MRKLDVSMGRARAVASELRAELLSKKKSYKKKRSFMSQISIKLPRGGMIWLAIILNRITNPAPNKVSKKLF